MRHKEYTKYRFWNFTWGAIIGLIIAILSFIWMIIEAKCANKIELTISMILSFLSIIVICFEPIIKNEHKIKKAYDTELLSRAISKAIEASKQTMDSNRSKRKYEHFLKEITQAERLNPLYISFDDAAYDDLYDMKGTISITDAPVFAWKNPEYNWFLLNHYVANLLKRLELVNRGSIILENRNEDGFQNFIKNGMEVLSKIGEGYFEYDSFVRFYILTEQDLQENRAMVEQFVAGHELFGINLFLIDKNKIIDDKSLNTAFDRIKSVIKEENDKSNVLDIMVYMRGAEKGYKIGRNGKLENESINEETETACDRFIKDLAKKINENKELLFYPVIKQKKVSYRSNGFKYNKKKTFLYVKENANE